jgi:DnaJ-class molecular chaperone
VYDERSKELKEGETAESRFIQIQAAYELLMDSEKRQQYDIDHRINPLKVQLCTTNQEIHFCLICAILF